MNLYYFNINDNEFILKQIGENQKYLFDDFNKELDEFVKPLFREYVSYLSNYGVNLGFQEFETELANLPGVYSNKNNGTILVILNKTNQNYLIPIGIVALKDLKNEICEMKRFFVIKKFRGLGLGRILMDEIIQIAKLLNYKKLRWDTLKKLMGASGLYGKYNCRVIEPYNYNPYDDVIYFEMDL